MTYCNALKLFSSAPASTSDAADRLRLLLSHLGNPERRLRILPVTGEKGKSSVVRMLSAVMAASEIAVVAVTYPCLNTPKDNVFVGDKSLSNEAFVSYATTLASAQKAAKADLPEEKDGDFTRDELLFCLALIATVEKGAKWLILEIPSTPFPPLSTVRFSSALTVITSCGARVRPSVTGMIHRGLTEAVSARLTFSSAYTAISSACARAGCRLTVPVFSAVKVIESSLRRTVFTYRGSTYTVPLYGEYSLANALCALEAASALRRLGCPITDRGIAAGLAVSSLPARAEVLSVSPTVITDAADDPFSLDTLRALLTEKGPVIGERITLCIEDGTEPPDALLRLSDAGFTVETTVRVPVGKENRTATLLMKAATAGDLILTVGSLPFVYTMRNEFSKVLRAM